MPAMTVLAEEIPAWQLTEDSRYWRVVEAAGDRRAEARLTRVPAELFRWHSISCACEECLDTDVVFYAYDSTEQIDMTTLIEDQSLKTSLTANTVTGLQ